MKRILILVVIFVAGSIVGYAQWVGTNPVYFNAGNVGIGTSTPAAKLHLFSAGGLNSGLLIESSSAASYSTVDYKNSSADLMQFGLSGSTFVNGMTLSRQSFWNSNAPSGLSLNAYSGTGFITFGTGGLATTFERMRIAANGNVGIGTTTPQTKLDINVTGVVGLNVSGNNSSFIGSDINASRTNTAEGAGMGVALQLNDIGSGTHSLIQHSSGGLQFFNWNGSSFLERMRISANGNVGIGTATPSFKFHIRGGNANSDLMTLGSSTTGNFALTSADGGAYGLFAGVSNTGRAWLQAGRYDHWSFV